MSHAGERSVLGAVKKNEPVEVIVLSELSDKPHEEKLGKDPSGGLVAGQMTWAKCLRAKAKLALPGLETILERRVTWR